MSAAAEPIVGVLALQGDFAAHAAALGREGLAARQVRRPADLAGLAGLVLPGGESTTMLRLLALQGLAKPLVRSIDSGLPVLATCAGLILLASEVVSPSQPGLGLVDATVARNGYGRQVHSGVFPLHGPAVPESGTGVFIRAPRVLRVGAGVDVLAYRAEDPVLLRHGAIWAACFHPELEPGHWLSRLYADAVRSAGAGMRFP